MSKRVVGGRKTEQVAMKLKHVIGAFRFSKQRGSILVIASLLLGVLLGFVALGVEVG